jgi:hypothetical protein
MVPRRHSQNRGSTRPRTRPKPCRVRVKDMRNEEDDRNRTDRYQYRAYYSARKNGKKIFEVDQVESSMNCNEPRCKT